MYTYADNTMLIRLIMLTMSYTTNATQRHINGVVSENTTYDNFGFGGIKRPF